MVSIAQTRVTEVAPNGYLVGASYVYLGGTTSDTLTDADTLTYVLRIKGDQTMDIKAQIYNDFVSGTATGKLKSYKSIDGITYVVTADADSITVASITADILDSEELTYSDALFPYVKFIYIQAGTGVNIPRIYIYGKVN
jgi:hypothetical protein